MIPALFRRARFQGPAIISAKILAWPPVADDPLACRDLHLQRASQPTETAAQIYKEI